MIKQTDTEIFNGRGRILAFIAKHPGCRPRDIADGLFLSKRSVWGATGSLITAGYIRVEHVGRESRYWAPESLRLYLCELLEELSFAWVRAAIRELGY